MNFELKIKKYQNTSTGKWETTLSDGYEKIRGKVFDIKMYKKDPRTIKNAEGKRVPTDPPEYLDNGYWTAKVELSGIHLAKSIPIEAVPEEKIKNDDFKPGRPWDLDYPEDTFFKYVAYEASEWVENEFKRIYGTKIKLDSVVSNDPSATPVQDPIPNPPIQQAAVSSGAFTADYISTNSTDALNDPISISYIITKDLGDGKEPVYINVNDSKNFSIDQVTKKIKILVSNVFYDINGNWLPQYGSVALIPKEQILDLSGYPDKPQIGTLPPKRISTIDNKVTSDGISKPLPVQKDYTFDVREPETFFNTKLGKFFIIGRGVIREEEIEMPEEAYLEGDEEDEYVESDIEGADWAVNPLAALDLMKMREEETVMAESEVTSTSGGGDISLPGGGSMSGKLNFTVEKVYTKPKYLKGKLVSGWGKVTKGMTDEQLIKAVVDYIEGGYYHPIHAYTKFNAKDRGVYGSSGETLWGMDRHAGQTEGKELGKKFWKELDKITGYGNSTGNGGTLMKLGNGSGALKKLKGAAAAQMVAYARATNTNDYDSTRYPKLNGAWNHGDVPKPGTAGYDTMYNAFVAMTTGNLMANLNANFGSHPMKDLILSDSRMKLCWLRATWNGGGWFQKYAKNIKKVYDSGITDIDKLIIEDLNHRHSYSSGLIKHDSIRQAQLLGIENS
jgi:hypothetical protein